jgi:hypothetical protein
MRKRPLLLAALLLFLAGVASAQNANSQSDFLRAYVRALRLADAANQPFTKLPTNETGTPAHVAEFLQQTQIARGALAEAIAAVAPFTISENHKIAESATLAERVFVDRDELCDRWIAFYADVAEHRGTPAEFAQRVFDLRRQIDHVGEELGTSAIAAAWGIVKIDAHGWPQGWAVPTVTRRASVQTLRATFGTKVVDGPDAGMNYVETAAATLATFISHDTIDNKLAGQRAWE